MIDVLKSKSRLLSLLLVVAVLLAYMPGLAEFSYGDTNTTTIVLEPDSAAVRTTLTSDVNNGVTYSSDVYVNYADTGDGYDLILQNGLDRPDLYFEINVGDSKDFRVLVDGEVTIGGITMYGDTWCQDVEISAAGNGTPTTNPILNADEISFNSKVSANTYFKFTNVDVNANSIDLSFDYQDSSKSSYTFELLSNGSNVKAESMKVEFEKATSMQVHSVVYTGGRASTYDLGSFETNAAPVSLHKTDNNKDIAIKIGNLTATNTVTIEGANVEVTGKIKASKLKLCEGTFKMNVAGNEIGEIDFDAPYGMVQQGTTSYKNLIAEYDEEAGVYTIDSIGNDGEPELVKKTSGTVRFAPGYSMTFGAIDATKVNEVNLENMATGSEIWTFSEPSYNYAQVADYTPVKVTAYFSSPKKVTTAAVNGVNTPVLGGKYGVAHRTSTPVYYYEGYVLLGKVTGNQVFTFDFADATNLCTVSFYYGGESVETQLIEPGNTIDMSEMAMMEAMLGGLEYYSDPECTKPLDLTAPVTSDLDVYMKLTGMKTITGSMNVKPLKTCRNANFDTLNSKYCTTVFTDASHNVFMTPELEFDLMDSDINLIVEEASGTKTAKACTGETTEAALFTDTTKNYYAMYRLSTSSNAELADSFKVMCGNTELKSLEMSELMTLLMPFIRVTSVTSAAPTVSQAVPAGATAAVPAGSTAGMSRKSSAKYYLVPIEIVDHDFTKLATTGSDDEYYVCSHCEKVYKKTGSDYALIGDASDLPASVETASINDAYTVDEEGNHVLTLTEDLLYANTGVAVDGDLIIDLNGHKLGVHDNLRGHVFGATGDVTIKNGTVDTGRIVAKNLIFDNVTCTAPIFYNETFSTCVEESITLQNGSVMYAETKAVFALSDGRTIEIKDSSKIIFSADTEITLMISMMIGKSDLRAIVDANLYDQIKDYLPRTAKAYDVNEYFNADGNMDPKTLSSMQAKFDGMYFIEYAGNEIIAANWPASSGKHSNDSSKVTVETTTTENADGSKTTTATASDGSTSTTVTDASGAAKTETAISEKAVEEAVKENKPITVPMESAAATIDTAKAQEVKINLPAGTEKAKVEIPVKDVSPSVVAVLVKADGTEEIITKTMMSEDGIVAEVKNGETIKIVDNHKEFTDTANHWAKDDIDFITARGVFNGTGKGKFDANGDMTRGMLMTVMARYDGVDASGKDWQEKGAAWAKENGISDGTKLDAKVSRADLVTMLWRYAGSPVVNDANTAAFNDADKVKDYAKLAMEWAVKAGLIEGNAGSLDPEGSAQRGQLAAIMHRFMVFMESK